MTLNEVTEQIIGSASRFIVVGLLINFNVKHLRTGIRRLVNGLPE